MTTEQELDKPVTCPSNHRVGNQAPLYEEGVATGWFMCVTCLIVYKPLPSDTEETCDVDGDTEDQYGGEHYWHCEELAVFIIRGYHSLGSDMKLCREHLEEVTFV